MPLQGGESPNEAVLGLPIPLPVTHPHALQVSLINPLVPQGGPWCNGTLVCHWGLGRHDLSSLPQGRNVHNKLSPRYTLFLG